MDQEAPNLHFDYTTRLLDAARAALAQCQPRLALDKVTKALGHLDILARTPPVQTPFPRARIEARRRELVALAGDLQVSPKS